MTTPLLPVFRACAAELPAAFRAEHERLFAEEHLAALAERLEEFRRKGVPAGPPPPYLAAECTAHLEEAFAFFHPALVAWEAAGNEETPEVVRAFAAALAAAGCANLLLLLGQRRTPASVTDARAIPPLREVLLASADRPHTPGVALTVAARALAKHAHRSPGAFWGTPSGPAERQNEHARQVLGQILGEKTWWNVFGHYQHELVYEARVRSGHGARWGHSGEEFIGFLEPFEEPEELTFDDESP
ncbi:MAG TPA: hypothetical protein VIL46_17185 [Gemmataceae bacterium]